MKVSTLIVLVGLAGTSCAHMSKKCCKKKDHHGYFKKMDKNDDGMISKKEWNMGAKDKFKMMDADGNSKISMDEWKMGKRKGKSCKRK